MTRNDFDWMKEIQDFSTRLKGYFENFERPAQGQAGFAPPADAYATNDAYHVEVELPGVEKDAIRITMSDSVLEISGEKARTRSDDQRTILSGRRYGAFQKKIALPGDADVDLANSTATYNNGVLFITLPKRMKESGTSIPVN